MRTIAFWILISIFSFAACNTIADKENFRAPPKHILDPDLGRQSNNK